MSIESMQRKLASLRTKILEDAMKKADSIIADANHAANEIRKGANIQVHLINETRRKKLEEEHDLKLRDDQTSMSREFSQRLLSYKQKALDEVIAESVLLFKNKMVHVPDYYYNTYLPTIINHVLKISAFTEYFIIVNTKDKEYIKKHKSFLSNFSKSIYLREDVLDDQELGCVIEDSRSLVKFDCTLSKRILSSMHTIKMHLSVLLFEGA